MLNASHPPFPSASQLGELLGLSRYTVYKWIRERVIPEHCVVDLHPGSREGIRIDYEALVEHWRTHNVRGSGPQAV
jgi:excisionase family DNA binding protein